MKVDKKYRNDIQALRGISVLSVVFFHGFENYFRYGYLGVDAFFVISGFVIAPLIIKIFEKSAIVGGEIFRTLYNFYIARFYRLAPALFVSLTFSLSIIFILGPRDVFNNISLQALFTLLILGNYGSYKLNGNYFLDQSALNHTWSLSVEEQIYFLIPLFILCLFYRKNFSIIKLSKWILFLTIMSLVFVKFGNTLISNPLISVNEASNFIFYSPFGRVWQFTIGFLGFIMRRELKISKLFSSKICGRIILSTAIVVIYVNVAKSNINNSILISFLVLIIIFFESLRVLPKHLIILLKWFGDRSYSIYLYHMPLIYLAKHSPLFLTDNDKSRTIKISLAILMTFLIAWLSYAKVENRFRVNNYEFSTRKNLQAVFYLFLLSFLLSFSIFILSVTEFFGLIKNVNYPQFAGSANQNCENGILMNRPLCKYELVGAKKTVLLYGDSFAGSISSALITASRNQNLNLVTSYTYGCALNIDTSNAKEDQVDCARANTNTLHYIKVNKPDLIIVSYYMDQYLDQKRFKNLLIEIKSFVPNLLLIENIPIFPDSLAFMQHKTIFSRQVLYKKYFTENSMNAETRNISSSLSAWAINNNIDSINFSSIFCQNKICRRFEDSNWLYSDNKHLSIYGAIKTIPMIAEYLSKLK